MWLMTKYGFFSIVQKKPGVFHIRAREKGDLENLVKAIPCLEGRDISVQLDKYTDYPCRLIVNQLVVSDVMDHLGKEINYPNFKQSIKKNFAQINKRCIYYEIWDVVSSALGRYGKPGYLTKNDEIYQGLKKGTINEETGHDDKVQDLWRANS